MLLVALTGGIGSGKSTVAAALERRGAVVVDADKVARSVLEPGKPAYDDLVAWLGTAVLDKSGAVDRQKVADVVFADDTARARLNAITHPRIQAEMATAVLSAPSNATVITDIPLLSPETAGNYQATIVVEAPVADRLDRLVARGLRREDAQARMDVQLTDAQRRQMADYVIDNGGSPDDLEPQIDELWESLQAL